MNHEQLVETINREGILNLSGLNFKLAGSAVLDSRFAHLVGFFDGWMYFADFGLYTIYRKEKGKLVLVQSLGEKSFNQHYKEFIARKGS